MNQNAKSNELSPARGERQGGEGLLNSPAVLRALQNRRAILAAERLTAAHKTECAMREHVWFPRMKQKIRAYCDNCGACKTAKAFKRHHAGALKSTIYWEVFDDWAIDLQGPFLESVNGNKYHLHMVCLASNWNVSVAIPNKEARTVAAAIHKNLIIGGPCTTPKRIVSDKGSEFIAAVTEELFKFKQFGIKHLTSTAGHPTSNAVCERGHRTYGAIMRAFLHKYGVDWEDSLAYAAFAMNTHVIEGTNVTPYELVFGRKPSDPNALAVKDPHLWGPKADKRYLSPPEFTRLRRARMADTESQMILERLDRIKKNQSIVRQKQYSYAYDVGELALRWTANPKVGVYGKLAYKTTGPYEVVAKHPRNPDVYALRPLAKPNADPTMVHIRELVPYITRDAHEKQEQTDVDQEADALLEVKVGDHLLLKNGPRDFLTKVLSREGPYVTVHYYNTKNKDKDKELKLVYYRQNPDVEGEHYEEIYVDSLSTAKQTQGWAPWTEQIHLHLFYQRIVEERDMKIKPTGRHITPLRRAAIRKAGPLVAP